MDLENIRREYLRGGLRRSDLADDPLQQFALWLQQAIEWQLPEPTAMTLATVSADGQPSQRIVLLKRVDDAGFVFYTNLSSRKAKDMAANGRVSLHFPWHAVERQVKVCGSVTRLSTADAWRYFVSRPRESQLAAWASAQSQVIDSRSLLLNQFESMRHKFAEGEIPLPDFWGGYHVTPTEIEFWQGGAHRLHDRFRYLRQPEGGWRIERLAP